MSDALISTLTLLLVLGVLVVAHEWGHFIVARIFKIRVDDFSIGFGKRILRIGKLGDTEYNIRILPLGGFVKIAGMDPDEEPLNRAKDAFTRAKHDPDSNEVPLFAENKPDVETPDIGPDGFNSKPLWQRALVIVAGPAMSFVTGFLIFCIMGFTTGISDGPLTNRIAQVNPGGEGQKIGLLTGDTIVAINQVPVKDGYAMMDIVHNSVGKPLNLLISRKGKLLHFVGTPQPQRFNGEPISTVTVTSPGPFKKSFGVQKNDVIVGFIKNNDETGAESAADATAFLKKASGSAIRLDVLRASHELSLSGVAPPVNDIQLLTLKNVGFGLLQIVPQQAIDRYSVRQSVVKGYEQTIGLLSVLKYVVKHNELKQSAGGVVAMYQATSMAVKSGPERVLDLAAKLSISLAIFNMLPIPVLDGGHLLAFIIEFIRRGRKMTERQYQAYLMTGLAIITVLFVLITGNNLLQTFQHKIPQ